MAEFEPIKPLPPLLQEIKKQTDPHNFMDPYDAQKVKCANELHQEVYRVNTHRATPVMELLIQTMDDLGCTYDPQLIYQFLHEQFDPTKHNSNPKEFDFYNNLCQRIFQVKDSIREMNQVMFDANAKREAEEEAKRKKEEEDAKEGIKIVAIFFIIIILLMLIAVGITQCQH